MELVAMGEPLEFRAKDLHGHSKCKITACCLPCSHESDLALEPSRGSSRLP